MISRSELFEAWWEWLFLRWERGGGMWCGGLSVYHHIWYEDYDGFGGEW